ncbi:MAG: right-handed parallel beta-helix repeat-containing protein [Thermoanaerobaculia bacterium]|nr:right-handed parallel beta-helix repeat-containing protein [Thermoanaerobaculia bacterium]
MPTRRSTPTFVALLLVALCCSSQARAQATRTWVSGVGDDANPCSRTAPCKTFAGAISKTAAKGEINVLDPGGFGGVTITKSITINSESPEAGVLITGANGIVINALATDTIVLRGLDLEGLGTGLNGIQFLAGGTLHVEKCVINGFSQSGINVATAGALNLLVKDSIIRNNNPTGGSAFAGINLAPTGASIVEASLENVRLENNFHGLRLVTNTKVTARNTTAASNSGVGFFVTAPNSELSLDASVSANNGTGIRTSGSGAVVRLANTTVSGNTLGLAPTTGAILSFVNNRIAGNTTDGAPTGTIAQQ